MEPNSFYAQDTSIQKQIDQAKPGDTISIPTGIYDEAIVINKPLSLVGEGDVEFQVTNPDPIMVIQANDVKIENIHFTYDNTESEQPAIFIQGNRNLLTNLHINTNSYAIRFDGANDNIVEQLTIHGDRTSPINGRKHGIDLWKSNKNIIRHTEITSVQDGIYVESSNENTFHDNIVTHSRYGYHLMFTQKTELFQNESFENISGMMIMGTNGTKAYDNVLQYNQKNVQSLGLLLFDVENATITYNDISHNRIGIFVEDAKENEITNNTVAHNFVGLQFKRAEDNIIHRNTFLANVVQGQAEESFDNVTNKNYWSDHLGLDMEVNGISSLVYEVNPFYLHLTNEYPPYRLLFQAPGMIFLEQLLHTPIEQRLIDQAPLMSNPLEAVDVPVEHRRLLFIFSLLLVALSTITMIVGVKKS